MTEPQTPNTFTLQQQQQRQHRRFSSLPVEIEAEEEISPKNLTSQHRSWSLPVDLDAMTMFQPRKQQRSWSQQERIKGLFMDQAPTQQEEEEEEEELTADDRMFEYLWRFIEEKEELEEEDRIIHAFKKIETKNIESLTMDQAIEAHENLDLEAVAMLHIKAFDDLSRLINQYEFFQPKIKRQLWQSYRDRQLKDLLDEFFDSYGTVLKLTDTSEDPLAIHTEIMRRKLEIRNPLSLRASVAESKKQLLSQLEQNHNMISKLLQLERGIVDEYKGGRQVEQPEEGLEIEATSRLQDELSQPDTLEAAAILFCKAHDEKIRLYGEFKSFHYKVKSFTRQNQLRSLLDDFFDSYQTKCVLEWTDSHKPDDIRTELHDLHGELENQEALLRSSVEKFEKQSAEDFEKIRQLALEVVNLETSIIDECADDNGGVAYNWLYPAITIAVAFSLGAFYAWKSSPSTH